MAVMLRCSECNQLGKKEEMKQMGNGFTHLACLEGYEAPEETPGAEGTETSDKEPGVEGDESVPVDSPETPGPVEGLENTPPTME